ncbi:hypothetical protein FOL47_002685 [Perkinsus chesapeaki]|uniref:Uncharacterized protein n=1 Tax=Perkinsus chesapeaki TaxID=330153 RepID=A0A7J6KP68_PERCH|nr:hypothetical protein FOL47_002685 [Perkinsus chesapeaki]
MAQSTSAFLGSFFDREMRQPQAAVVERNSKFIEKSLRDSTQNQYRTPVSFFEKGFGPIKEGNAVSAQNLVTFTRGLMVSGTVKAQTIKQYVSAVKSVSHIRTGEVLSPKDEATVSRALSAAENILSEKRVPPKRASCLPDSCLQALKGMQLQFLSEKDQIRSGALLGCVNMLRFDQVATWRVEDVTFNYGTEGLLVKARYFNTKTRFYEEREMLCEFGPFCEELWCPAHWVVRRVREAGINKGYMFPALKSSTFSRVFRDFLKYEFPSQYREWNVASVTKHSLRRSGAAALASKDTPGAEIRLGGGWQSQVWEQYSEEGLKKRCRYHAKKILS